MNSESQVLSKPALKCRHCAYRKLLIYQVNGGWIEILCGCPGDEGFGRKEVTHYHEQ